MKLTQASRFLKKHTHFIITAHETPDGDALGSECALYHALIKLKKKVHIFNADETPNKFSYLFKEEMQYTHLMSDNQLPENINNYVLVILDTNDIENIGQVRDIVLPRVSDYFIIDHHENEGQITTNHLIQVGASSTCELLYDLFEELKITIDFSIAEAMYTGIVYDTGSFIYPKTTSKTFHIAYQLVRAGVFPNDIYSKIYESNSVSSLVLQSKVLNSLTLYYDQQVAVQIMRKETIIECKAAYEEADTLINIPLKSERIRVSVFFKENLEGVLRCSLRSKGNINVAEIAQSFSGGGHKTAAGFKCKKELETIRQEVLKKLEKYFDKQG